ncbi:hypothetical protein [Glycomyces sp. NPDC021274]|uniref:hypothetical protein n=1 Tax=Glycomyces sp. NPDC021274 TaxID=3155120 RepID=UPI0033EB1456
MTDDFVDVAEMFFGAKQQDATSEQLRKAKTEIGALMAETVVAKVATGIIAKQAEAIRNGVEGDRALSVQLNVLAGDCESKLRRISEGWDTNPTDTRFTHSRGKVLEELDRVHDAAQSIADLTKALSKSLNLPEGTSGD